MSKKIFFYSISIMALIVVYFSGIPGVKVKADKRNGNRILTNTPQALPFSQNWTNAALITANDDWAGVPGIVGFLGNYDAASPTNVDPRTLLAPFAINDVDVIANQTAVSLTNGGVAEFDGIANPVVALNGSGTADAPHIVIYLNTTGNTAINLTCNLRDIDDTIDNAAQQVDIQYRVGGAGDYISVAGGYFADVTSGPSTTMTTAVNLTLPATANNQPNVEIRVITTNAGGNDEWVGIDDINVTGVPIVTQTQHVADFDGDGKTDWVVTRAANPQTFNSQITWMGLQNGGAAQTYVPWGIDSDFEVPEDYDGDGKTDIAVWRSGGPSGSGGAWFILQSQTGTVRAELWGQFGDDPTVVGDYDGDGKADLAAYRRGATAGAPSFWYYRTTPGGPVFNRQWGQNGDTPAPGDYDGDGKNDFVVRRPGGAQGVFYFNYAADPVGLISRVAYFGSPTTGIAAGDYDGDGKTDLAVFYQVAPNTIGWAYEPSTAQGTFVAIPWGFGITDVPAQGDYDGDGKTDLAVYRSNPNPDQNFFIVLKSSDGGMLVQEWGEEFDVPVVWFNTHANPVAP